MAAQFVDIWNKLAQDTGASQYINEMINHSADGMFSDYGSCMNAADKYCDALQNIMEVGNTIEEITSVTDKLSSSGGTAVARTAYTFLTTVISSLSGVLLPMAFCIMLVIFVIQLCQFGFEQRLNFEVFSKHFGMLAVGAALCLVADKVTYLCINFGNAFGSLIAGANLNTATGSPNYNKYALASVFYKSVQDGQASKWTYIVATFGLPTIFTIMGLILKAVTYVVVFTRLIEMSVRAAGMPVAIAFFGEEGTKGPAMRYIKKFLAVCCQGVFLSIIGKVTIGLMASASEQAMAQMVVGSGQLGNVLNSLSGMYVIIIGIAVACIKVMFSSLNFANDLFGV